MRVDVAKHVQLMRSIAHRLRPTAQRPQARVRLVPLHHQRRPPLGKTDPMLGPVIGNLRQRVEMMIVDAQRNHLNPIGKQIADHCTARDAPLPIIQPYNRSRHDLLGMRVQPVIRPLGRRSLVIPFDVPTMFALPKTARVPVQPCPVGIAIAVIPIVPSPRH